MTHIDPINWRLALLTQNPFLKTPPSHPEEAIWIGFPDRKKQLDTVFTEAFSSSRTQTILIRGEHGSGKTHAATFYRRKDLLAHLQPQELAQPFEIIYVRTSDETNNGDMLLYQNIIEALGFKNIRALIKDTIIELGSEAALAKFQKLAGSETLGKALWLLGYEKARSGQLTLFQDKDIGSDHHKLLERYFYAQNTKSDLKRLDLSRSIDSIRDRFQLLSTIFQCFIGLENREAITSHRRIILWIDEMEDVIIYDARSYRAFTHGLRDLIDHLPRSFTLLMNVTLASYELDGVIRTVLGKALTDRITGSINFREPSEGEALEYVKDLMRYYRTEDFEQSGLSATYPFREDALHLLISNLTARTPHNINQYCADVIETALKQGIIHEAGKGAIDTPFVQSVEDQRIRFDME